MNAPRFVREPGERSVLPSPEAVDALDAAA